MERRKSPRQLVDRPAKILMPGGGDLPCRIENTSEGGAKLRLGWKVWPPNTFYLQDVFTGVRRGVQTVWTGLSGIGVRFRNAKPEAPRQSGFGRRGH